MHKRTIVPITAAAFNPSNVVLDSCVYFPFEDGHCAICRSRPGQLNTIAAMGREGGICKAKAEGDLKWPALWALKPDLMTGTDTTFG